MFFSIMKTDEVMTIMKTFGRTCAFSTRENIRAGLGPEVYKLKQGFVLGSV